MKKYMMAMAACAWLFSACSDDTKSEPDPVVPDPDPVEEPRQANTWILNDGEAVEAGSVVIYEADGEVTALFSSVKGLTTAQEFDLATDYTEITFPISAIGSEIDLASLSAEEGSTYVMSRLPEFGKKYGLLIDGSEQVISQGSLSSSLEGDEITVNCSFTTLATEISFDVYLRARVVKDDDDQAIKGSEYEYAIKSRDISGDGSFRSAFYLRDGGWTLSYSASRLSSYLQIGDNTYVEIFVGDDELGEGKVLNIADTAIPFSFKLVCIDRNTGETVTSKVDNSDRAGAAGSITLKRNSRGLYDVQYDLSLKSGDVTAKGVYADALQPRNMIYTGGVGNVAQIRSVTLDLSGDPCMLYLSSQSGTAGPGNYDVKCEVPASEWRYDWFMSFSGQDASVVWADGIRYDKTTSSTTPVFGGNWKVTAPVAGVSECTVMLFGSLSCYAYYYGPVNVIK